MNSLPFNRPLQRRTFLGNSLRGLGSVALASLLDPSILRGEEQSDRWRGVITTPHVPRRARRVIFLVMAGGPSHLETFDYKPKLAAMSGKPIPESLTKGQPIAQLQ